MSSTLVSESMPSRSETVSDIESLRVSINKSHNYSIWQGLLFSIRLPGSWTDHLVPVDLSSDYRRHLVWAKRKDNEKLLQTVTARYLSTSVFLSLFVSSALATFFSPSDVVTEVRDALRNDEVNLKYFAGIALCISALFSLTALIANITAWSIFIVVSKENASAILRSSLGLYAAQLPSRLVIISIYMYLIWVGMFWFIIMPPLVAVILSVVGFFMMSHVAATYSAMGQVIISTSAMSADRIIPIEEEEKMLPRELHRYLVYETNLAKKAKVPVNQQYRMGNYRQHLQEFAV